MLGNILGSLASSVLSGNNQSTATQLIQNLLASQGGIEGADCQIPTRRIR